MAAEEEIAHQQELLKRYRRNLAHLVKQVISFGGEDAAPLSTMNSLDDTRANIRRIKGILRGWGIAVEDHPDDADQPVASGLPLSPPTSKALDMRRRTLQRRIDALSEEHDAVERQINNVLDLSSQVRLQRQLQDLEAQIGQLEEDMQKLTQN